MLRPRVTIIIPVFNQVAFTRACLDTLFQVTPAEQFDLVVVDNGSTDGTGELLVSFGDRLQVITNDSNLGFAKACNQGARAALQPYLLFLNNDTIPHSGWLSALVETAERDPEIGVVGSKLLYPDGTVQHAGLAFDQSRLPYHVGRGRPGDDPLFNQERELKAVTGACMLIRRGFFEQVGGFDEGFRNGCEDVDLCLKLGELGKRVVYQPQSVLTHHESRTEGRNLHLGHNEQRFLARWRSRVRPDDQAYRGLIHPLDRLKLWLFRHGVSRSKFKERWRRLIGQDPARVALKRQIDRTSPVRIVVGANHRYSSGWIPTEEATLNLLKGSDWRFYFKDRPIDAILAEHVWEHLTPTEGLLAARNCFQFLKPGGYLRVAVPDGLHPDPAYIDWVRPGGTGPSSDDHKLLYTYRTFRECFEQAGFHVQLLEYFDENGEFRAQAWEPDRGIIWRSLRFDHRNRNGQPHYTSIILDACKPPC